MLHWNQIHVHMRQLTQRDIEKRAVAEVINYFEPLIDTVIQQSNVELDKLNEYRIAQGLEPKKRIDQECIKKAITVLNSEKHSPSIVYGGERKERKKCETHLPNSDLFTEVT